MPEAMKDSTRKPKPSAPAWKLLVFYEGGSSAHALVPNATLVIGRGDECQVKVAHESVSRRHAELTTSDGWRVTDLGSSNGTFVGTTKLARGESASLAPGAIVKLGDARLVIDWSGPPDAQAHSPSSPPPAGAEGSAGDLPMDRVLRLVDLVAKSALPVLLLGETGAGKGWLAREIHDRSERSAAPFMSLNCAAMPEALLESELFGHERGAFTGAVGAKAGLLEAADGGTVFLDEIGEASASTQAKLLHVLERSEVMRVGGVKARPVNVRFLAATNREVDAAIAAGTFRRDLYFRLAGVPLRVPPLRERANEIPDLVRAFLADARPNGAPPEVAGPTLALLTRHRWSGNIRELRNVVARASLLCKGDMVLPEHLVFDDLVLSANVGSAPAAPSTPPAATAATVPPVGYEPAPEASVREPLVEQVRELERARIAKALDRFNGHQGKAAEYLGLSRRTLTNKLNEHDLPRPRKRTP